MFPTAAKKRKPIKPKRSDLSSSDRRRLEKEWNYLQSRLGGQKALAGAIINPKTGKAVDARTLRKWWSGERRIPDYAISQINQLDKQLKHEEARLKRRRKLEKILGKIRIYPFDGWFAAVEAELYRDYEEAQHMDETVEKLLAEMTDLPETPPETVLFFGDNVPGWISSTGKHNISQLCRSDLILYGIVVFVNGNYTRLFYQQHRPPQPMWNYEDKHFRRKEDIPKLFELIREAWENLSANPFGFPILIGFTRDPEQLE